MIYITAWNCPPCFAWTRDHKPALKKWLAGAEGRNVSYRVVEAYTYKRIAEEGIWPDDIRWVKDKLKLRRGAPRWIILDRKKIVLHSGRWTKKVWPRLQGVAAATQRQE